MDVSIGEEAEEVEGGVLGCHLRNALLPGAPILEHLPTLQGHVDQFGPLGNHATTADAVVPNLRVAHISVIWEAHVGPVSIELSVGVLCMKHVQEWRIGCLYSIRLLDASIAHSVYNAKDNRAATLFDRRVRH